MKLVFSGQITLGDSCRCGPYEEDGAIRIGDRDFVEEVEQNEKAFTGKIIVAIACDFLIGDTTFEGALKVSEGWGYSEYTPMDSDQLFVVAHDIKDILENLEGRDVTVWVSDEPLNILEGAVIKDGVAS